jgi:hypothetical protein
MNWRRALINKAEHPGANCTEGFLTGWASICADAAGNVMVDHQNDVIPPEELAKAVHQFMQGPRTVAFMHERNDDGSPMKIGEVVESMVTTPALLKSLGLVGKLPVGWLVTVKIDDPKARELVRKGLLPDFSIGGRGKRTSIEIEVS